MKQPDSVQIIVAGLPRTATMSLKAALQDLGYGPCHHLLEPTFQITRLRHSAEVLSTTDDEKRREKFRELYQGYEVVLDLPGSACVDDLIAIYPQAKVILTKRQSASVWLESVKGLGIDNTAWWFQATCYWIPGVISSSSMSKSWLNRHGQRIGKAQPLCENTYTDHNEWIRSIVPQKQLLEFEPSMGWKPLCNFLDVEIPDKPFPRRNDRKYLRDGLRAALLGGILSWALIISAVISCLVLLQNRYY